ncbi:MAG: 2-enoate reductase, partial [Oscillospiraceae bacterium]|nr:2-enoate reductase [Oscillospiraceae bacterium]
YLEHGLAEIEDGTVLISDKVGAKQRIPADSVILSTGYKPQPLAPAGKHVHLVGDCSSVGNLRTVVWQAWDVAMKL